MDQGQLSSRTPDSKPAECHANQFDHELETELMLKRRGIGFMIIAPNGVIFG